MGGVLGLVEAHLDLVAGGVSTHVHLVLASVGLPHLVLRVIVDRRPALVLILDELLLPRVEDLRACQG